MLWYKMGSRPHSRNSNRDLRATTACTFWTSQLQKVLRTPSLFFNFWLRNVLRAKTACTFSTSQLPKVLRHWGVLYILTLQRASRHNGVHFLNIWTSKSSPDLVCFVHFDFEMCFAPHRRALFQHLNFQKCSEPVSFYTFDFEMCFAPQRRALFRQLNIQKCSEREVFFKTCSLANVLRATTTCNFLFLIWPDSSAPAALGSLLFDPPAPQIIGKTQVFRDFRSSFLSSFFWLLLFADLLFFSSVLFSSLTLPTSASTSACPYCRKFDF